MEVLQTCRGAVGRAAQWRDPQEDWERLSTLMWYFTGLSRKNFQISCSPSTCLSLNWALSLGAPRTGLELFHCSGWFMHAALLFSFFFFLHVLSWFASVEFCVAFLFVLPLVIKYISFCYENNVFVCLHHGPMLIPCDTCDCEFALFTNSCTCFHWGVRGGCILLPSSTTMLRGSSCSEWAQSNKGGSLLTLRHAARKTETSRLRWNY